MSEHSASISGQLPSFAFASTSFLFTATELCAPGNRTRVTLGCCRTDAQKNVTGPKEDAMTVFLYIEIIDMPFVCFVFSFRVTSIRITDCNLKTLHRFCQRGRRAAEVDADKLIRSEIPARSDGQFVFQEQS